MGAGITLHANGALSPSAADYRKMIYEKGQAAAPGDRVIITAMTIKGDRIIFDLNGGPYAKHRFLSHIQLNDNPVVASPVSSPPEPASPSSSAGRPRNLRPRGQSPPRPRHRLRRQVLRPGLRRHPAAH